MVMSGKKHLIAEEVLGVDTAKSNQFSFNNGCTFSFGNPLLQLTKEQEIKVRNCSVEVVQ
ncbi:hypothetical protein JNUCC23_11260 [Peribacillus sp. JNUCC 23]